MPNRNKIKRFRINWPEVLCSVSVGLILAAALYALLPA